MPIVLSVSCHETEYILRSLAEPCDPFYQSCPLRSLQVTSNTQQGLLFPTGSAIRE